MPPYYKLVRRCDYLSVEYNTYQQCMTIGKKRTIPCAINIAHTGLQINYTHKHDCLWYTTSSKNQSLEFCTNQ